MKTCSKKVLSALLALMMAVTVLPAGFVTASAKTNVVKNGAAAAPEAAITLTNSAVTNITDTGATIGAELSSKQYVSTCGFYIGLTSGGTTKQITETVDGNMSKFWYNLADDWQLLTPGTTYYYKLYVIIAGTEYQSPVASFKTTGTAPATVITVAAATNITDNDAKIGASLSPVCYVTTCGFYIGTSGTSLTKVFTENMYNNLSNYYYNIASKWKALSPGTTYYYKMFATVGGTEYQSAVASFKTTGTAITVTAATSGIKDTDAKITGTLSDYFHVIECGFYIGLESDALNTRIKEDVGGNMKTFYFNLASDWKTLTPGTPYYYRMFVTIGETEYLSDIISFKTTGQNPVTSITYAAFANITYTDALITASLSQTVNNIESYGVHYGTSDGILDQTISKTISGSVSSLSFNFSDKLKPGTTYYFKVFVKIGGEDERTSTQKSFTTLAGFTKIKYRTTELGDVYNYRVGLFKYYKNISLKLDLVTYSNNSTGVKWTSDNASVVIDQNGMITNTGKGPRSSYITAEWTDNFGTVYKKSVLVNFYKMFWDKK